MLAIATADLLMFAGIALATGVFVRMSIRRQRSAAKIERRSASEPMARLPRPQHAWDGSHRDPSALIERQKVELQETAREAQSQLASKIAVLERLVAASSSQIKQMQRLLDELQASRSGQIVAGDSDQQSARLPQ